MNAKAWVSCVNATFRLTYAYIIKFRDVYHNFEKVNQFIKYKEFSNKKKFDCLIFTVWKYNERDWEDLGIKV